MFAMLITKKDFDWAVDTASKKKKMDCSGAEFLSIEEGLCVHLKIENHNL